MRFLILALCFCALNWLSGEDKKKIIFLSGKDSHAYGHHEHRAGCYLLAKWLNKSGLNIQARVYEEKVPSNKVLESASAIILFSNGNERHPFNKRFKDIDELMKKGIGLSLFHFALEVPEGERSKYISKWMGGFYKHKFSTNPHWNCNVSVRC